MKLAFSTLCAPNWDLDTIAARAKEYGYDGVEIRGFLNENVLSASNVFLSDPAKVRQSFHNAGVEIACLSSSVAFHGQKRADEQSADELIQFIDTARVLDCRIVKIGDAHVRPKPGPLGWALGLLTLSPPSRGASRADVATDFARWLAPVADYAASQGVMIVIENLLSFRNAKELWLILEMVNHPSVAACWDVLNAALIGETPAVSVPVLNSRIQYVQVKDATLSPLGATYVKLGEGNARVQDLLKRLQGIGYDGWICFEWEKAWLPSIQGEPEEMLPDAAKKLREWTEPQVEEEEKKKPEAAAKAKAPAKPADPAPAVAH
jgi:sugar phosphate isomerase/epimerase